MFVEQPLASPGSAKYFCGDDENDEVAGSDSNDVDNVDDGALALPLYLEAVPGLPHLP